MNGDRYGSGCFIALVCPLLCGENTLPHYGGISSALFPLAQNTMKVAVERCLLFGARVLVSEN